MKLIALISLAFASSVMLQLTTTAVATLTAYTVKMFPKRHVATGTKPSLTLIMLLPDGFSCVDKGVGRGIDGDPWEKTCKVAWGVNFGGLTDAAQGNCWH